MEFDDWLNDLIQKQNSEPETNDFVLTRTMESPSIPMFNLYHGENQLMTYMREKDVLDLYETLKQWADHNGLD